MKYRLFEARSLNAEFSERCDVQASIHDRNAEREMNPTAAETLKL